MTRILPTLDDVAGFAPGDFVDDNHLDIVLSLVSDSRNNQLLHSTDFCSLLWNNQLVRCTDFYSL
jgi:hypothetical protein